MSKQILFGLLLLTVISTYSYAAGPGTTSANFIKSGQGVRPIAMGETYTALGDGLDTLYWNPAGLIQLESPEATFTHSFWIQDITTEYLAFGTPLGILGAVGGGITYMNTGTVTQTLEDEYGNYIGTGDDVSAMNLALIGTYAQKLSRLIPINSPIVKNTLFGASLRIVSESIDELGVFGGALDIGAIWKQTEEINPKKLVSINELRETPSEEKPGLRDGGWRVGVVAQNLGMTTDQVMPINFRVGGGYLFNDLFTANGRLTLALDTLIPIDNSIKISFGGEYAYLTEHTKIAARFGYKAGNEIQDLDAMAGFTAGIGVSLLVNNVRYQVDYAFVPYGDLGSTHRASLTVGLLASANKVVPLPTPQVKAKLIENPYLAKAALAKKQQDEERNQAEEKKDSATAEELKKALKRIMGSIKAGMLPAINFDRENDTFVSDSKRSLGQIGKQLERCQDGQVVILGFAKGNAELAQKRAEAVLRYLTMNFRVNPERLTVRAGADDEITNYSAINFEVDNEPLTNSDDRKNKMVAQEKKTESKPQSEVEDQKQTTITQKTESVKESKTVSDTQVGNAMTAQAESKKSSATPEPVLVEEKADPASAKKLKKALERIMGSIKADMLPAIEFERGTDTIATNAKRSLGQIGKQLEHYQDGQVIILGFAKGNAELAQKRAEAALRYLKMNFRVNPERLTARAGSDDKDPKYSSIEFDVVVGE